MIDTPQLDASAELNEYKPDIETVDEIASEPIVEPVHAIFGLGIQAQVIVSNKKSKKLRIQLLRTEEDRAPFITNHEPASVVARINKN